jgi:hypothetical protein
LPWKTGTHSIWVSEQIQELGHEVIVANVRELRAISHSDRKSDKVDAEKIARYARLDPEILRPIAHRSVAQQETLTLIRARDVLVHLRTGAVNSVRGLVKPCGYRLPASSTLTFAKRCLAAAPPCTAWRSTRWTMPEVGSRRASPVHAPRSLPPSADERSRCGHCFVEGQSRFRTVPGDELIDSMLVFALRVGRTKARKTAAFECSDPVCRALFWVGSSCPLPYS